jgi:IS5 family transposase
MKPKTVEIPRNKDLFRPFLVDIINPNHELVRLEKTIDWDYFEKKWTDFFTSTTGRPATSPRLIAGLFYLQHLYAHSDKAVLSMFLQSPYYQHFCGRIYFEHELPIDPSSLVRWRKRVGEVGMEELLLISIQAAVKVGMVKPQSFTEVIVDTTVMEKAITHPTDSKLLEKSRQHLVKLAEKTGISLRQNYNRLAPRQSIQTGRYAHAKQFKRMRSSLKKNMVRSRGTGH